MNKIKNFNSFISAQKFQAPNSELRKGMSYIWDSFMFFSSSVAIGLVSLLLGLGGFPIDIFIDYFRVAPIILVLNILPVIILQLVFLCIFNRQWAAFLLNALIILGASIGNYYKLKFRGEPFSFSDISAIVAGLRIAGQYDLTPNARIWIAIFGTAFGSLFLAFFAKGKLNKKIRIPVLLLCLFSVWPLWKFVYSNEDIYNNKTSNFDHIVNLWDAQVYVSKGFIYPFIYSIHDSPYGPPDGYIEDLAIDVLSNYEDINIPEDRRVNVMIIQLETFVDLEAVGFKGIAPEAYEIFHKIQAESISGRLITNVFAGGTLDTEQCVMTGNYSIPVFNNDTYSYIWYMHSQGYNTFGVHPWMAPFYNRQVKNEYLGFDEYFFYEDCFKDYLADDKDQYVSDYLLFPQILDEFRRETSEGNDVFSYSISMQGHAPFSDAELLYDEVFLDGEGYSEPSYNMLNNFLYLHYDTQVHLYSMMEELRREEEPVVLMFYGDHMPLLSGNNTNAYIEAGINLSQATEEGFYNYYGTPYIIWANEAAKSQLGNDFVGKGEDTSAGYLMNILFNELGWEGPAKMQFTEDIRSVLRVINSNGYYRENNVFTTMLSEPSQELLKQYDYVQYYLTQNFIH